MNFGSIRVSPRHRRPGKSDDFLHGYCIDGGSTNRLADRWNSHDEFYVCGQNAVGNAAWLPVTTAGGYPGSSISAKPLLFAGGTLRMVAGYNGPALNVVNPVSGANRDIYYLADDTLDEKTMWSFMGSSGYLQVATIYDNSGTGNHITQLNAANRYLIQPGIRVGNAVALTNDSNTSGALVVERFMVIPSTLTVAAGGSWAASMVASTRNRNTNVQFMYLSGEKTSYGIRQQHAVVAGCATAGISECFSGRLDGFVCGFGASPKGENSYLHMDRAFRNSGNSSNDTITGGFLGKAGPSSQPHPHDIAGMMIYGTNLYSGKTSDVLALQGNLEKHFGLSPQIVDTLILDGDSITYGYGSKNNFNYPRQMMPLLSHDFRIKNTGFFGAQSANRLADQSAIIANEALATGNQNVWVEWIGTNDIAGGVTLATMQSNLVQIVANAKAAGMRVIVVTCLPRASFPTSSMETQRQAWNAWLLSGASGADAVADVASDATMGSYTNYASTTYYVDGTHPTSLGYSYIAPIIAAAINSLVH